MPVFFLEKALSFPDPRLTDEDGLLAVGGDLSPERLLLAYYNGIFPWFSEGDPLLWWCPDPRLVLFPGKFHVSHSLKQLLKSNRYSVRFDSDFAAVIHHCAEVERSGQPGTWITAEMKQAYIRLHELGFAHSVETWEGGELVGGLYGVSIGRAFFGESMFHLARDASKFATWQLASLCMKWDFQFIDAQMHTSHLVRLGAEEISRESYLVQLAEAVSSDSRRGNWQELLNAG